MAFFNLSLTQNSRYVILIFSTTKCQTGDKQYVRWFRIKKRKDFQDWVDSYWAKDIQELYRLEKRYAFQKFLELILAQSGSIFEATRFTAPCEVSRGTIVNYLNVLECTHLAHVIRPFNTHRPNEIISAPKVYGFDTGFICYYKGWMQLRKEDFGILWEHLVLNELQGQLQTREIRYWRDKQDHEVDFIWLPSRQIQPVAIECTWKASSFDPKALKLFRELYPQGGNFIVAADVKESYQRQYGEIKVMFVSLPQLIEELTAREPSGQPPSFSYELSDSPKGL